MKSMSTDRSDDSGMPPQRFFDVALPAIAARREAAFGSLRGTISVAIAGDGAWTIHLGDLERPVTNGATPEADLTLFLTEQAFGHLLDGALDLDAAVERKAVGYRGDLGLLEKLGFLLSAGGTADGVQVDQVPIGIKRV